MSQPVPRSQDSRLNNVSRMYHSRFEQAYDILFTPGKEHSDAYDICEELLGHADLPVILVIKCHYLLAHGSKNFVAHAVEADRLLSEVMKDHRPSEQLDGLREMVDAALKQAREDAEDPKWKEKIIGSGGVDDDEEEGKEGKEEEEEGKKTEST